MTPKPDSPIPVNTLLTHVHPDLDASFSIYLLRRHGDDVFPGAGEAGLSFVSANELPGGKSPQQLEQEGVIAVDTGGGRLDTHPVEGKKNVEKWDTCAAQLVAEACGVADSPRYRYLLPYTLDHDARGKALSSKNAIHHLLAPHGLIEGLHRTLDDDAAVVDWMGRLLDGLAASAEDGPAPLVDTAARFDRTLLHVLEHGDWGPPTIERGSENQWPATGRSHEFAQKEGWAFRRDMEKLLQFAAQLLADDAAALPDVERERYILLPAALDGLARLHGEESELYRSTASVLLTAAITREKDWFDAIDEVERSAKVHRGRGVNMASIASNNGLTIKACRYRRGVQAVLYYHPDSQSITLQSGTRKDGSPTINLERVAKRLRGAEVIRREGNGAKLPRDAGRVGMFIGWFLHPSLKLLNRGSRKAPDVEPSALTWPEIIELVRTEIRPDDKMPDWFCPPDRCLEARCTIYPLRLLNCKLHRDRTATTPKTGTLGDQFGDKLAQLKREMNEGGGKKKNGGRK